MTCRRLEDDDALAELVHEPDHHTRQCPDCSARLRGYQRIAGWIAEGKTGHRAPAEWRQRTLAQLRAQASAAPPAPSSARQLGAAATPELAPVPEATRLEPTRGRAVPSGASRRKRRPLAVFAFAGAAIIAVTLAAMVMRGDGKTVRIALGSDPVSPDPVIGAPPPGGAPPSAATEPSAALPPAASEAGSPAGQRRGVKVIIDFPWDDPSSATVDISIDTTPPGAQVVLDGAVLGTTPYRGTLPRSDRRLELALRLAGFVDQSVVVEPSRPITRHIHLVPVQRDP